MASVLSWEPEEEHPGVSVASEVLAGNQREVDEEDQRRSRVEAWEEDLAYLEARGDPWEVHTVLWEACP